MYSDRASGVVIPFPRAARMSAIRQDRARILASSHTAPQRAAWRDAIGDALALAGMIAMAAVQAALLLCAFGLRMF